MNISPVQLPMNRHVCCIAWIECRVQATGSYASPSPPQPLPSTSCSVIAYGAPSQAGSDSKALLSVTLQSDGRHFEFDIHHCTLLCARAQTFER